MNIGNMIDGNTLRKSVPVDCGCSAAPATALLPIAGSIGGSFSAVGSFMANIS
jgi:hypothetical protein